MVLGMAMFGHHFGPNIFLSTIGWIDKTLTDIYGPQRLKPTVNYFNSYIHVSHVLQPSTQSSQPWLYTIIHCACVKFVLQIICNKHVLAIDIYILT